MRRDMTLMERVFCLKNRPPFHQLEDQELLNLTDVVTVTYVSPGEPVITNGKLVHELYILADGNTVSESGVTSLKILGIKSLLKGTPAEETVYAGNQGALLIKLGKGHFFTTIYECPRLMMGLMKLLKDPAPYFC